MSSFHDVDASKLFGVLGGLANGPYDVSLTSWTMTPGRALFVDSHTSILDRPFMISFHMQSSPADLGMHIRPMALKSWAFILGTLAAIGLDLVVLARIGSRDGPSSRMFKLMGLLFYMVVHGVYSGALTTNFIVKPDLPFKTIGDGLKLYPEWKMCVLQGYWIYLQAGAEGNNPDPDYVRFWETIKQNPDKYSYKTPEELLDCMMQPNHYIVSSRIQLAQWVCFYNHHSVKGNSSMVSFQLAQNERFRKKLNLAQTESEITVLCTNLLRRGSPYTKLFSRCSQDISGSDLDLI